MSNPDIPPRRRKVTHCLLVDNATGWFTRLSRVEREFWMENHEEKSATVSQTLTDVPVEMMNRPFLSNIFSREPAFTDGRFRGDLYTGWSLSEWEHARLARLIELAPGVAEFKKLAGYNV